MEPTRHSTSGLQDYLTLCNLLADARQWDDHTATVDDRDRDSAVRAITRGRDVTLVDVFPAGADTYKVIVGSKDGDNLTLVISDPTGEFVHRLGYTKEVAGRRN